MTQVYGDMAVVTLLVTVCTFAFILAAVEIGRIGYGKARLERWHGGHVCIFRGACASSYGHCTFIGGSYSADDRFTGQCRRPCGGGCGACDVDYILGDVFDGRASQ